VDFLDFEADELYFDQPIEAAASEAIEQAAASYGEPSAENWLLRAYFLEPEHPVVLVALYRFFYYQHRLSDALLVAERVLRITARALGLPEDWRHLDRASFTERPPVPMPRLRFYMLALKGAGYLELRLGDYPAALQRLERVVELDDNDRLGAATLLDLAKSALQQSDIFAGVQA
jgi:tetratricopeptide (TPR) repeat protein